MAAFLTALPSRKTVQTHTLQNYYFLTATLC